MGSIYDITGDFLTLLEMAQDGDVPDEVLADTLEGVEMEFEDKADSYAKVIASLGDNVDAIDKEIKRLTEKKKPVNNNIKRIKDTLENAMRVTGKTKFKTALYSFGIQKNPASLRIIDELKIPKEYYIPQPDTIDKKAIKDYIKDHGDTEWAELIQGEGLRIR